MGDCVCPFPRTECPSCTHVCQACIDAVELAYRRADDDCLTAKFVDLQEMYNDQRDDHLRCHELLANAEEALDVARKALEEVSRGTCPGPHKPIAGTMFAACEKCSACIASRALTDIAALTASTATTTGGRDK